MNNITLKLTINAALELLVNSTISPELRTDIQNSILLAFNTAGQVKWPTTKHLGLTLQSVPHDYRVRTIAAIRNQLGWGLKESKDFVDVVTGKYDYDLGKYINGTPNSLYALNQDIKELKESLERMGCEVFVDTWGCGDPG